MIGNQWAESGAGKRQHDKDIAEERRILAEAAIKEKIDEDREIVSIARCRFQNTNRRFTSYPLFVLTLVWGDTCSEVVITETAGEGRDPLSDDEEREHRVVPASQNLAKSLQLDCLFREYICLLQSVLPSYWYKFCVHASVWIFPVRS